MNQEKVNFVFEIAEHSIMTWISDLTQVPLDILFQNGSKSTRSLYINKSFRRFYEIKPEIMPFDYQSDFNIIEENSDIKPEVKTQLRESIGFVLYSIKTVFMSYIHLLKKYIEENKSQSTKIDEPNSSETKEDTESSTVPAATTPSLKQEQIDELEQFINMGLSWDNVTKSFYIVYIHPDIVKRDHLGQCMNKLLTEMKTELKQTKEDWNINWNITYQQFNLLDNKIKQENIDNISTKINEDFKLKKRIGININEIKESEIPHQYRIKSLPNIPELSDMPSYEDETV